MAAAIFVISSYWFFAWSGGGGDSDSATGDRSQILDNSCNSGDGIDDRDKVGLFFSIFIFFSECDRFWMRNVFDCEQACLLHVKFVLL